MNHLNKLGGYIREGKKGARKQGGGGQAGRKGREVRVHVMLNRSSVAAGSWSKNTLGINIYKYSSPIST